MPIDLLIVLSNKNKIPLRDYESLAAFSLAGQEQVTFSIHRLGDLLKQLQEGHIFYSNACDPSKLIYDSGSGLNLPEKPANIDLLKKEAKAQFETGFTRAHKFLTAARFYHSQGEKAMTAFMLQQTIELTLRALILSISGCETRTHEIRVLKRHCERIAPQINDIFPGETEDEENLLTLVDKAYKNTRYAADFEITNDDLELLLKRATRLQDEAREIFNDEMK